MLAFSRLKSTYFSHFNDLIVVITKYGHAVNIYASTSAGSFVAKVCFESYYDDYHKDFNTKLSHRKMKTIMNSSES